MSAKNDSPISRRRELFRRAKTAVVSRGGAAARAAGRAALAGARTLGRSARSLARNKKVRESASDVVIDEGTSLGTHGAMYMLDRHQELSGPVPWYKRRSTWSTAVAFLLSLGLRVFAPKATTARRIARRSVAGGLHAILGHGLRERFPSAAASTSTAGEDEEEDDGNEF